jgi:hypothetical protein
MPGAANAVVLSFWRIAVAAGPNGRDHEYDIMIVTSMITAGGGFARVGEAG